MEQDDRTQYKSKEEVAIILDILPNGHPLDHRPGQRPQAVAQAIGKNHFSLLELVPKKDNTVQAREEVYIGEGKRDKVHHVLGRVAIERLTPTANAELESVLHDLVKKNEARFVQFFNEARPLTTRMHQLELIPGFGKKHMWEIIERRQEKPFASFADMRARVHLMPDPEKGIVKRLLAEIAGTEKHNLFVEAQRMQ